MTAPLRQALTDYLTVRRALGFRLARAEALLDQFVEYLDAHQAGTVTIEHAVAWATLPADADPWWWALRLSPVRGFATYLHSLDPSTQVPPAGLIPARHGRATPYLYSDTDLTALLAAAGRISRPLPAASYQTLLGLLAVTGMRVGEAISLDRADLDPDAGLLQVREGKFGKSRLLPLHPSTVTTLAGYLRTRDQLLPQPATPALLISARGTRLRYNHVWETVHRLIHNAGLGSAGPAGGPPRIHDLRHSFAVATVLGWYRDGADVQALLPRLSTYLGHTDPKHTYWYLSAAPELLALAEQRLETHRSRRP
jgi:integrase